MTNQTYVSINNGTITNATVGPDIHAQISQPQSAQGEWIGWTTADGGLTFAAPASPAHTPQAKGMSGAQYILFVKQAGGITGSQYLAMKADGDCAAFLDAALADRDLIYPTTDHVTDGLELLAAKGFLPNGMDVIIANWPTI